MSRTLGDSSVNIVPNFDSAKLQAKLDEIARKSVNIAAKLGLDTKDADGKMTTFTAASKKALGNLVGKLSVSSDEAIGKLLDFRLAADKAIGDLPKGKLSLDDSQALVKALEFRTKIDAELKRAGVVDVSVTGEDKALLKLAKFQAEAAAIQDSGSGSSGGFSAISNAIGSLGEYLIPALVVGLVAATPLIVGVAAGLTAAAAGAGAFALLATPAIEAVSGALGDTKAQLDKLPEGERNAVEGVKGLETAWKNVSKALDPAVFTLINKGVGVLGELLPSVTPFAKTFASALGQIEGRIGKAVVSPGFVSFLKQLHGMEGPSLEAIANGVGHIMVNLGKLLTVMSAKDVVNALNITFSVLDGTVIAVTRTIQGLMIAFDATYAFMKRDVGNIKNDVIAPMVNWFETSLPHAWSTGYQHFMSDFASPIHAAYSTVVSGTRNDFVDPLVSFFTGSVPHAWSTGYTTFMANFVSPIHAAYSTFVSGTRNDFIDPIVNFFTVSLPNGFRTAVTAIGNAWDGIKNAISAPVKFVINTVYDNGIRRFWDDIAGHVGLPQLPSLSFAGGGVVPGTSSSVTSDTHLAAVKGGELIIPSQHAPKFADAARRAGIDGFAAGGIIPSIGSIVHGAESVANDVTGGLFGKVLNSGVKAIASSIINPLLNAIPSGSSQLSQIPKDAAKTLVNSAISTLTGKASQVLASKVNYSPSAGVNQWAPDVARALTMLHLPLSLEPQVLRQISSESGGNPNAINNWDSNAAAGDPSRGILQTTGSTFSAYHVAGTSNNIYDPLANIAAAINYAEHAYGPTLMSGGNGLGSGHGYSAGGVTPEKIIGLGLQSGGAYAFGAGEHVSPGMTVNSANASGLPGMTQYQGAKLIDLLGQLLKVSQQAPSQYARSLNGAVGGFRS